MLRPKVIALLAAAALLPAGARADDDQWEGQYTDEWTNERPSESYDVSVDDVGASSSVTFETFQSGLSPYGQWVASGSYGRVWRPNVAAGWRPYYYGRWEWTNEGWLWVSDEPFGWAAYHYGRWSYDSYYGWVWVPGYQWAPAWVSWRYSGDVVGWAPLAPGLSIYVSTYPFYDTWWTFVPTVRFVSVPVYQVAYAPRYTRDHYYRTAPAPARPATRGGRGVAAHAPAWGGPAPRTIEQRLGRPVRPVRVVASPSPSGGRSRPGEVSVYRPERRAAAGRDERGRGPGYAPSPGRGGERRDAAPVQRGGERRGVAPVQRGNEQRRDGGFAPGRGGERRDVAPVQRGNEQRRDGAWAPGRGGERRDVAPVQRGNEQRRDGAFAPGRGGERRSAPVERNARVESRQESRNAAPAARPAQRSDGGRQGQSSRPAPASRGGRGDDRRR